MDGITSVALEPQGQFLAGQGVFMDLAGETLEAMLARNPSAMYVTLDESSKGAGDGARAATLERLRRILLDARAWAQRRGDFERRQMRDLAAPAADLEALQPVLAGRLPLVVTANRVFDIRNALRLAREFNLRIILRDAAEGWQVADEIARAGVGVILEPETDVPTFNQLGARYSNPARLARAGVRIAIVGGGDGDGTAHNTRLIRQEAGNAVATGLDWDAALHAVTLSPAELFGVADRYGSLDVGKVANVVVWSGDPFEFSTAVEHVFIRGREIPLSSRQTELLERYRTLPPRW
jgi:imidazolonepropionase-like amidohydrolase